MKRTNSSNSLGQTTPKPSTSSTSTPNHNSSPRTGTGTPINKIKKKLSKSSKDLPGLKWFKGSPSRKKKSLSTTNKLKNLRTPQESSPSPIPLSIISSRIVEFEVEGGGSERFGVVEPLDIVEKNEVSSMDNLPLIGEVNAGDGDAEPNTSTATFFAKTPKANNTKSPKSKSSTKTKTKSTMKKGSKLNKTPRSTSDISKELLAANDSNSNSNSSKLPEASWKEIRDYDLPEARPLPLSYIRYMEVSHEDLAEEVEYDLDEEDCAWLELVNEQRAKARQVAVAPESMEFLMDRLEKESHFQMQSTGIDQTPLIDDDAVCCICLDGECENSNAILFCDMCNLAVHQNCYGVPYIPEGQWLCRKCLQSPSRPVDCILCPNKGGAFKQTTDGRWAHVNCVLWVPEVCFANTVFLEPVDSVSNIPQARWKLTCFICKQKGVGACIQCYKTSCYTAFHVTCAIQANLCMKMETVRCDSSSHSVKKMAYCNAHAPVEFLLEKKQKEGEENASPRQKMKLTRKLLAEKRESIPAISVPTIPPNRLENFSSHFTFSGKSQFLRRLMAYWKLKRQTRNGVPLIRRLQSSSSLLSHSGLGIIARRESMEAGAAGPSRPQTEAEKRDSENYGRFWIRLRQDLERARLLCELIRKREKLKRQVILNHLKGAVLLWQPLNSVFRQVLDELDERDPNKIFAEPVDLEDVPDYLNYITQPMDLATMRHKVESFAYTSLDQLEADFQLMIHNCLSYNNKETSYYKDGLRFRDQGGIVFRYARRQIESVGYDSNGQHTATRPHEMHEYTDEEILEEIDMFIKDNKRFDYPPECHVAKLNELMDKALGLSHPPTRKRKMASIKNEIARVRNVSRSNIDGESYYAVNRRKKSKSPQRTQSNKSKAASLSVSLPRRPTSTSPKFQNPNKKSPRQILVNLRSTRTPPAKNLRQRLNTSSPRIPISTAISPSSTNIKGGRELRPIKRPTASPESSASPTVKSLRSHSGTGTPTTPITPSPMRKSSSKSPTRSPSPMRKQSKISPAQPALPAKEHIKIPAPTKMLAPPQPPKTEPKPTAFEPLLTNSQIFASALSCNKFSNSAEGAVKEAGVSRNLFGTVILTAESAEASGETNIFNHKISPPKDEASRSRKISTSANGPLPLISNEQKEFKHENEDEPKQNYILYPPKLTSFKKLTKSPPSLPANIPGLPLLPTEEEGRNICDQNEDSNSSNSSSSSSSSRSSSSSSSSTSTCSTESCAQPHPTPCPSQSKNPYEKQPPSPDILVVPNLAKTYSHHQHHHHRKLPVPQPPKRKRKNQGIPTTNNNHANSTVAAKSPPPKSPNPTSDPDPLMPKLVPIPSPPNLNLPSIPSFTNYRSSSAAGGCRDSEEDDEEDSDEETSITDMPPPEHDDEADDADESHSEDEMPNSRESESDEPEEPEESEQESESEEHSPKKPDTDDPPYTPKTYKKRVSSSSSSSSSSSGSSSSGSSSSSSSSHDDDDKDNNSTSSASSSPHKPKLSKKSSSRIRSLRNANGNNNNNKTKKSKSRSPRTRAGAATGGTRNCQSPTLGDPLAVPPRLYPMPSIPPLSPTAPSPPNPPNLPIISTTPTKVQASCQ